MVRCLEWGLLGPVSLLPSLYRHQDYVCKEGWWWLTLLIEVFPSSAPYLCVALLGLPSSRLALSPMCIIPLISTSFSTTMNASERYTVTLLCFVHTHSKNTMLQWWPCSMMHPTPSDYPSSIWCILWHFRSTALWVTMSYFPKKIFLFSNQIICKGVSVNTLIYTVALQGRNSDFL